MASTVDSYTALPFTQIKLSHHPTTSKEVTPVIIVTLYRPENNNAWTKTMIEEILQAYKLFDSDDRVKCIVFTGHGRMFCAGADLDNGFNKDVTGERNHRDGYALFSTHMVFLVFSFLFFFFQIFLTMQLYFLVDFVQ
jgi:enoyl-CoA hydratase/carnithine racemase